MDLVARLIAVLLLGLGAATAAHAYGSVSKSEQPGKTLYNYTVVNYSYTSQYIYSSVAEACAAGIANLSGYNATRTGGTATSCVYSLTFKSNGNAAGSATVMSGSIQEPSKFSCPSFSSETASGQCECALNFKPGVDGKSCDRYDCPAKGSYSQQVSPDVKLPNAGDSFCSAGCTVTPSSWKVDQEGQVWGVWPMKSANQACGGKKDQGGVSLGDDKLPEAPVACPTNQCPGSVNGTSVCVPCKSATTPGPSSSASGAQPGDPPKDPADPDSAVKGSTSQTTCVGAVCTTVTKYYDGRGNEVGSKTEEQAETDYCQKNPSAPQCKKDSFGGACEGGFTCEGDAVECALAKEVHTRNCQWFKEPSQAILDAGDRALSGGILPDGHPYKEAMNAGPTSFSLSNKLDFSDGLGGGCPTDTVVSALGQTLVIPWSQYCVHLQMVGNLAVAVTLLICAFIVFKE